jgi:acetate kinase
MGFSTLDGLMMATRPGSLDPGVLIHLLRSKRLDLDDLEATLYRRSGLAAVGGSGGDMRALLASDAPGAKLAVALFRRRAAMVGAGLVAAMGGLDAIVFTGGIGEHSPPIRSAIAGFLGHLGVTLDEAANAANSGDIAAAAAAVRVHVVAADEERVIAREALATMRAPAS